jgi:hypothetical protein
MKKMKQAVHRPKTYGSYYDDDGQVKADLMDPNWAYFVGLCHTDGNMAQRTGEYYGSSYLRIRLKVSDKSLLIKLRTLFGGSVTTYKQVTNFTKGKPHEMASLNIYREAMHEELHQKCGMLYGRKAYDIAPPIERYAISDYWRGVIDGDGSIGFSASGRDHQWSIPFLSFGTMSEAMKNEFIKLVKTITGRTMISTRNQQYNMFIMSLYNEDAQKLIEFLYYPGCLALPRKMKKATNILRWKRPDGMKKITRWTPGEDQVISTYSVKSAAKQLNRSIKCIYERRYTLSLRGIKLPSA